jgi:hypothetical protein
LLTRTERKLHAMFEKYGYGIVACLDPKAVGEIIPGVNIGDTDENQYIHPFAISSETTKEEWDIQCALIDDDSWLQSEYKYFYRVTTD